MVVRMVASAKRRRGRGMVVVEVMAAQIAAGVRMRSWRQCHPQEGGSSCGVTRQGAPEAAERVL